MMIYGVQKQEDGSYLVMGSPDNTRYQTLQEAMRAAGRLNMAELDKTPASRRDSQLFTANGAIIRKTRHSRKSA